MNNLQKQLKATKELQASYTYPNLDFSGLLNLINKAKNFEKICGYPLSILDSLVCNVTNFLLVTDMSIDDLNYYSYVEKLENYPTWHDIAEQFIDYCEELEVYLDIYDVQDSFLIIVDFCNSTLTGNQKKLFTGFELWKVCQNLPGGDFNE